MNEKEISEIRRRFRADKSNITHVRGCYVNEKQEIVSQFDQPLSLLPQEECENMLSVLRRTLSGTLGKNLIEMPFTTAQVVDSDEHRLLMALRDSKLTDEEAVRMFFEKVIASYRPEGTYLILLANDTYDVPYRAKDGETLEDASENIYNYVLCTVCPVKQTKPVLGYDVPENTFHNRDIDWIVSAPQLGFLFPSFTDRSADIYSAMYYCRSASESYDEFIDAVFNREAPMPAEEQKTTFGTILGDALNDACSLDVVQTVHSRLCGMIEEHKASKDPEPLTITGRTMKTMLTACGVPGEKAEKFEEACAEQFGADAALSPQNRFWRVLSAVFGEPVPGDVPEKKALLLKHKVALWDVIASCDVTGSSDASIKNVVPNDLSVILSTANITHVCTNGQMAHKLYQNYLAKEIDLPETVLPSTSPANAAWSLERLTEAWKIIRSI